jgi:hypothetical protein
VTDGDQWDELVAHLVRTTGLPSPIAHRVVHEVLVHVDETVDAYLRRRHRELQADGRTNAQIFVALADEVTSRPFAVGTMSERQIRRAIYG